MNVRVHAKTACVALLAMAAPFASSAMAQEMSDEALANHLWSFAGDRARDDVNATFLQPFLSYTTPTGVSLTLQTESTYNWESRDWTVPVAFVAAKVTRSASSGSVSAAAYATTPQARIPGPTTWRSALS